MWARVRGEQSDGAGDILRSGRNELSRIMSQQRQYGGVWQGEEAKQGRKRRQSEGNEGERNGNEIRGEDEGIGSGMGEVYLYERNSRR